MTLRKVAGGQPFRPRAEDWNAFVDAAIDLRQRRSSFGACSLPGTGRQGIALVRNLSGADRNQFAVLWLDNPAIRPDDPESEQRFRTAAPVFDVKLHADITPLMRMMPWYKGAPTGQRRTYIRWGKQAYETKRWLEAPWASLMGKSSQIARWALEMATGESVGGYGWSLPFQDQGLIGWVRDKDGNFMGSRLGYTVQKFMPFSLLAWAQNPDAAPLQILGPTSKGISFYNATQAYMGILDTWARSTTYEQLYRNPRIQSNLEALGFDILEAARRNGYEPKNVIKSAVGAVMKDLYANLYKAVDANDQKEIERWSRAIIRLNGTVNRALQSTRNRDKMYGTSAELSKEHEALVREAFENP